MKIKTLISMFLPVLFIIGCTTFTKKVSDASQKGKDSIKASDSEVIDTNKDTTETKDIKTDTNQDVTSDSKKVDSSNDNAETGEIKDNGIAEEDTKDNNSDNEVSPPDYCGNGKCESKFGEDCRTCPDDCKCEDGQVCHNGTCCTPVNCEAKHRECGALDDGCGGVLDCGKCDDKNICTDDYCNGEGKCVFIEKPDGTKIGDNQVCYKGAVCTPETCKSLGYECGTGSNGCGGKLDCGKCKQGYICSEHKCKKAISCGDGVCSSNQGENCATCPDDCKCHNNQVCFKEKCCTPVEHDCSGKCGIFDDGCGGKYKCGCPDGQACCSGKCVDLNNDLLNCGNCNVTCTKEQMCCKGQCKDIYNDESNCGGCGQYCKKGTECCFGKCVNTLSDTSNCGQCGHKCGKINIFGSKIACCDGKCVDLNTDNSNCGKCGNKCFLKFHKCCNGSCVDLNKDSHNCGDCGNVCPDNKPNCCNGSCTDKICIDDGPNPK